MIDSISRNNFNDHYFDKIDSEEKAYWLGFVSRDATTHRNGINCTLARKDKSHLEKFLSALDCPRSVTDADSIVNGKSYPCSRISISGDGIRQAMNDLGLAKLKNEREIPIVGRFIGHFWRGVWDADGGLNKSGNDWTLHLSTSENYVIAFRDWVYQETGAYKKIEGHAGCKRVRWGKRNHIKSILDLLHKDSNTCLERKRLMIDEFYMNEKLKSDRLPKVKIKLPRKQKSKMKQEIIPDDIKTILMTQAHLEYESSGYIVKQWTGHFGTVTQSKDGILVSGKTRKWYPCS